VTPLFRATGAGSTTVSYGHAGLAELADDEARAVAQGVSDNRRDAGAGEAKATVGR
jgi:hypothetical protein